MRKKSGISLQSTHYQDVTSIQGQPTEVLIEVLRASINPINPFSARESALHLTITNLGENDLENLIIEALTSTDLQLVDSGSLFGSYRRHVRLPKLRAKKKIKYKLGIRPHEELSSGTLALVIKSDTWKNSDAVYTANLRVAAAR